MIKTAILVDGAFYRKRAYYFWGDVSPNDRATELEQYCRRHLSQGNDNAELYRVFYYDCHPVSRRVYHPILKRQVNLGATETFAWTNAFFRELKHRRKFALRMGRLAEEQASYVLKPSAVKDLLSKKRDVDSLEEGDFSLSITQKGVDMMIGVDISSLAFKKQVNQIILISGDSDFVPAAKQARREGIDFILDPMRMVIKDDLYEHIDGLRTKSPKLPKKPAHTVSSTA